MPYLNIHTNVAMAQDQHGSLLKKASALTAKALGKPEGYVMVELDCGRPMLFAGTDEPAAYLQLKSLGLPHDATGELSAALSAFMHKELGIDPARIYIEFASPERRMWGWKGATF